eukprot:8842395-Alexandrium_andersonii.AAC.1
MQRRRSSCFGVPRGAREQLGGVTQERHLLGGIQRYVRAPWQRQALSNETPEARAGLGSESGQPRDSWPVVHTIRFILQICQVVMPHTLG